jgi:hypothetical protein
VTLNEEITFAECHLIHPAKRLPLFRMSTSLHSTKGPPAGSFVSFFDECYRRHSAKLASLPSARATALGKKALPVPRCSFSAECYDPDFVYVLYNSKQLDNKFTSCLVSMVL